MTNNKKGKDRAMNKALSRILILALVISILSVTSAFAADKKPALREIANSYTTYFLEQGWTARMGCDNTFYQIEGDDYVTAVVRVSMNNLATSTDERQLKASRNKLEKISQTVDIITKTFKKYGYEDVLVAFTCNGYCYTTEHGWQPYLLT